MHSAPHSASRPRPRGRCVRHVARRRRSAESNSASEVSANVRPLRPRYTYPFSSRGQWCACTSAAYVLLLTLCSLVRAKPSGTRSSPQSAAACFLDNEPWMSGGSAHRAIWKQPAMARQAAAVHSRCSAASSGTCAARNARKSARSACRGAAGGCDGGVTNRDMRWHLSQACLSHNVVVDELLAVTRSKSSFKGRTMSCSMV